MTSVLLACGSCAQLLQSELHILLQSRYQSGPWLRVILGPLWQRKSKGRRSKDTHTHTQKTVFTTSADFNSGFAAEVMVTTSSGWTHLNHCISAGNHPCVQANTKPGNEAGTAQTTVIRGYITFLLSWLKSVNIDSWTHLFYITSLFWFYPDVLTGLTSHFGTRPFVSRRLFPASLVLGVLGAEGCCRKCRNSAYTEQNERKRDPWNKRGKQHFESYIAFMPKIRWQPFVGSNSRQSTFSDFNNRWGPPKILYQLNTTTAGNLHGVIHCPFRKINALLVVHWTALLLSWVSESVGLCMAHLGGLGGGERGMEWMPPSHSGVQMRAQASPASWNSYQCEPEAKPMSWHGLACQDMSCLWALRTSWYH